MTGADAVVTPLVVSLSGEDGGLLVVLFLLVLVGLLLLSVVFVLVSVLTSFAVDVSVEGNQKLRFLQAAPKRVYAATHALV